MNSPPSLVNKNQNLVKHEERQKMSVVVIDSLGNFRTQTTEYKSVEEYAIYVFISCFYLF